MNQVAAPVEEAPVEEEEYQLESPTPLDENRAHFRLALYEILANSLISRLWTGVAAVIGWLIRRQEALPFTLIVICFNLCTLCISFTISFLLGEAALAQPDYLLSRVVWVSFTVLYVVVLNSQLVQAVEVMTKPISESICSPDDFDGLQNLVRKGMWIPWQFGFSLVFGLICGVWIPYVLTVYSGAVFTVGAKVLHVFNYFQVGMYIYFLLVVISVLLALSNMELDIYANDPSNSPVVRSVYQVCTSLTLCAAGLGAIQYFLMLISHIDVSTPLTLITLVVLGWLPPLALFVTIHYSLSRIMTKAKTRKLAEIQGIIRQKEREGDLGAVEPLGSIQRLMDYHDRIKATPNSMINLKSLSNLLGSLLLPLIAIILGNLVTIQSFFRPAPHP